MTIRGRIERDIAQVNRSMGRYQRTAGTEVDWYEFDPTTSTMDPLFDEGERHYLDPKKIRVLTLVYTEGEERPEPEGLHLMNSIHLTLNIEQVTRDGLSEPENTAKHVKDRFKWQGQIWDVRRYHVEERIREFTVTVGVDAVTYYADENVNDPQFA